MECGRPRAGSVADFMRRSRAAYHSVVRRIRTNEAEVVRDCIAESMLNDKSRNFWFEIMHMRSHSAGSSKTVDGIFDSRAFRSYLLINAVNAIPVCLTTRVICSVLYRTLIIWSEKKIAQVLFVFMFVISELLLGI